jgi:putative tryptophan/tyrosine transport system substrate-binding protein
MAGDRYSKNEARKGRWLLLAGIALAASFAAAILPLASCRGAKSKTYSIGVLNPSVNQANTVKGFKDGMADLGYVEGKNLAYVYEGPVSADKLEAAAQDLVKAKVDLILSITTAATKAAQKATVGTKISVVFIPVTNPVAAGIVTSLKNPGGNTTGVTPATQEGKRLEWLLEVAPRIKRIYIVFNPKDQSPVLALKTISETALKLGVELITREANSTDEAMAAFKDIPKGVDAILSLPDSVVNARSKEIYALAAERKLASSGPNMETVNDGALTAYGVDLAIAARRQAARLADQILRGAKATDLPVETTQLFSAINLKTAQSIGLVVPDDILRRANVIVR